MIWLLEHDLITNPPYSILKSAQKATSCFFSYSKVNYDVNSITVDVLRDGYTVATDTVDWGATESPARKKRTVEVEGSPDYFIAVYASEIREGQGVGLLLKADNGQGSAAGLPFSYHLQELPAALHLTYLPALDHRHTLKVLTYTGVINDKNRF